MLMQRALCALIVLVGTCGLLAAPASAESGPSADFPSEFNRSIQTQGLAEYDAAKKSIDRGAYDSALPGLRRSLDLYHSAGDPAGEAAVMNALAIANDHIQRHDEAIAWHTQALEIRERLGEPLDEASAAFNFGTTYANSERDQEAVPLFKRAAEIRLAMGRTADWYDSVHQQAQALLRLGRFGAAIGVDRDAVDVARRNHTQFREAELLLDLGRAYTIARSYPDGLTALKEALALWRARGDRQPEGLTLTDAGIAAAYADDLEESASLLSDSVAVWKELKQPDEQVRAVKNLAAVHARLGQRERALSEYRDAANLYHALGNRPVDEATMYDDVGSVASALHRYAEASDAYKHAAAMWQQQRRRDDERTSLLQVEAADSALARADGRDLRATPVEPASTPNPTAQPTPPALDSAAPLLVSGPTTGKGVSQLQLPSLPEPPFLMGAGIGVALIILVTVLLSWGRRYLRQILNGFLWLVAGTLGLLLVLFLIIGVLARSEAPGNAALEQAANLVTDGYPEAAIDKYRVAIRDMERVGGIRQAEAFIGLGYAYKELGSYEDALSAFTEALAFLSSDQTSVSRHNQGKTLQFMGETYAARHQYEYAIGRFKMAADAYRDTGELTLVGRVLDQLGTVYYEGADFDNATKSLREAAATQEQSGSDREKAAVEHTLNFVTAQRGGAGDTAQLETTRLATAYFSETGQPRRLALAYEQLAQEFDDIGLAGRALYYHEAALGAARPLGDTELIATILMKTGDSHAKVFDRDLALGLYAGALGMFRAGADDHGQAMTLLRMAAIGVNDDTVTGPTARLELLRQAGEITTRLGDPGLTAWVMEGTGRARAAQNRLDEAEDLLRRAIISAKAVPDTQLEASARVALGGISEQRQNFDQAASEYLEAERIEVDLGPARAKVLYHLGRVRVLNGARTDEALRMLEEAWSVQHNYAAMDDARETAEEIAHLHLSRGNYSDAYDAYRRAIADFEALRPSLGLTELRSASHGNVWLDYHAAVQLAVRLGKVDEAFDLAERSRSRLLLDRLAVGSQLSSDSPIDTPLVEEVRAVRQELDDLDLQLHHALSAAGSDYDPAHILQLSGDLSVKQREYNQVTARLEQSNPLSSRGVGAVPFSSERIRRVLGASYTDTTLVMYDIGPESSVALVVTPDKELTAIELPVGENVLGDEVHQVLEPIGRTADPRVLEALSNQLVAPIRPLLTTRYVGIVSQGSIDALPFAALPDGKQYLADEFTFFYLPMASELLYLDSSTDVPTNSLVMAYGGGEGRALLPHVSQEARDVASILKVQPLIGSEATRDAFFKLAGTATILHIAAHAEVAPEAARIILAPNSTSGGAVDATEVQLMHLKNAKLVVLSACETRLGPYVLGEGPRGLTQAFLSAGASTVVASNWSVSDAVTQELMMSFYQHLGDAKHPGEALRAAELDVRKLYPDPHDWAAFSLIGSPGLPSAGPVRTSPFIVGSAIAIGIVILAIALAVWRRIRRERALHR